MRLWNTVNNNRKLITTAGEDDPNTTHSCCEATGFKSRVPILPKYSIITQSEDESCQSALKHVVKARSTGRRCILAKRLYCEAVCSFRIRPQIISRPLRFLSGSGWESVTWIFILLWPECCRWISFGHLPLLFCACQWNLLQARLLHAQTH